MLKKIIIAIKENLFLYYRDFAYVAKDRHSKIYMCHVFRCDSAPAKDIANALRDTCKRILHEKAENNYAKNATSSLNASQAQGSNLLKRPNYLNDFTNENRKIDINLKHKSISFCNESRSKSSSSASSEYRSSDSNGELSSTTSGGLFSLFQANSLLPAPMEEPKKSIRCKYLGSTEVFKPTGMKVLNDAIEKIYQKTFDEYKQAKKEKQLKRRKRMLIKNSNSEEEVNNLMDLKIDDDDIDEYECELNDQNENLDDLEENSALTFDSLLDINTERKLGVEVDVVVSPSTVSVNKAKLAKEIFSDDDDESNLIVECRVRYLCFMGISADIRLCGFIMHQVDNTFRCHAFLCENTSGMLCKTIEAACKLRYQKCLDAHPELSESTSSVRSSESSQNLNHKLNRFSLFGLIDTIKTKGLFSSATSVISSSLYTNRNS